MKLALKRIVRIVAAMALVGVAVTAAVHKDAVLAMVGLQGSGGQSARTQIVVRQPAALNENLLGWWKLDGNVTDSSTAGHAATFIGSPALADGKFGKAYTTSSGNYIRVAGLTGLDTSTTDAQTSVSFWMKWGGTGGQVPFSWSGTNYTLYMAGNNFGFNTQSGDIYGIAFPSTSYANQWVHVVAVFTNRTHTSNQLYINGVQQSLTQRSGTALTTAVISTTANFGVYSNGSTAPFTGQLDDFRIYGGALSQASVTKIYKGSNPTNCDQSCALWWKLDEVGGTSVAASIGNVTGTLLNGANSPAANGTTIGPILNASGVFSGGVKFDGTDDYVLASSSLAGITDNLTFSAWINPSSFSASPSGGRPQFIFSNMSTNGADLTKGWGLYLGSPNFGSGPFLLVRNGNGYINSGYTVPSTNAWYHVAVQCNAGTLAVYVNGTKQSVSAPCAFTVPNDGGATIIGNVLFPSSSFAQSFNGYIDDVRFYTRVLADYEIYDQYAAGR